MMTPIRRILCRARLQAIAAGDAASPVCNAMVVEGRAHRDSEACRRCVFGSNTDGVLRGAPCPVLTFKA